MAEIKINFHEAFSYHLFSARTAKDLQICKYLKTWIFKLSFNESKLFFIATGIVTVMFYNMI